MFRGLVRTMRPHQWVKNVFVLAPVVFGLAEMHHRDGHPIFDRPRLLGGLAAFVCFSLMASAVYVLNDLLDIEADRAHAVKKNRPIPSGQVSVNAARVLLAVLVAIAFGASALVDVFFAITIVVYLLKDVGYSMGLKRVAYVDVLLIAGGFLLRVLGGAFAAKVSPSVYLLVVTGLLATFLGLGKRMHELAQAEASGSTSTRGVLKHYSKRVVTVLMALTGGATVVTYVVYTLDPHTRTMFGTDYLVLSSLFLLFGVLRFLYLVRNRPHSESPTEDMLRDKPFLLNAALAVVAVVAIIYVS